MLKVAAKKITISPIFSGYYCRFSIFMEEIYIKMISSFFVRLFFPNILVWFVSLDLDFDPDLGDSIFVSAI